MKICFAKVLQIYSGTGEITYACKEPMTIREVADIIEGYTGTDELLFGATYMILINNRRIAQPEDLVGPDDVLTVIPVIQGG